MLANHELVIESIIENLDDKKKYFSNWKNVLSPTAIIGSNTSAIPVTILQSGLKASRTFTRNTLGRTCAHLTVFGSDLWKTIKLKYAEKIVTLAEGWGKEPSLVKKDIRGFITNRLMYAMMREAISFGGKRLCNV